MVKLNPSNQNGNFGEFGGIYVPADLKIVLEELASAYNRLRLEDSFQDELNYYLRDYVGRPTPLYYAKRLTEYLGGAKIYLKREDLNHTGAHKINNTIGQVLLARALGKKRIIAETGAGQHGVATATVCSLLGLDCTIYMGEEDTKRQGLNVFRMELLGAKVETVKDGAKTLKEAVDAALQDLIENYKTTFYMLGSAVGPHPYPTMVRDFQSVIGKEARKQILEQEGQLPDYLVACIGDGSNAIGLFHPFLADSSVNIVGVEPAGLGLDTERHAATLTKGSPGIIHGFKCYLLQDKAGNPLPVHSIAAGLDYPGVGPEHSHLKDIGRAVYETATDKEAIEAFKLLSKLEGIIPALESAHAIAYCQKLASDLPKDKIIIVNLSGRGDKDVAQFNEFSY